MRPKQPPSTLKQAREQSRRCLLRFPLTFLLRAYLLFSRRFLRLDSLSATETDTFPLTFFLLRFPRSICLTCSSLCLYRGCRRSHQRSPLSREDPLAIPLSVAHGSRQPRRTVTVPFRHLDWFILRRCQQTFLAREMREYRFRRTYQIRRINFLTNL